MRRPRELLAVLVVLVGGTLWLVVPEEDAGSLRDRTQIARWTVEPGGVLAAWVVVENVGPETITLTAATIGGALPEDVELLGAKVRIGAVPTVSQPYSGSVKPFLRLEGFEIPPGRLATIGFGLEIAQPGVVALEDVTVGYDADGEDDALRIRRTARLCVTPGDC